MESPRIVPTKLESVEGTRRFIDARTESNKSPRGSLSWREPRSRVEIGCAKGTWHHDMCYFKENGVSAVLAIA